MDKKDFKTLAEAMRQTMLSDAIGEVTQHFDNLRTQQIALAEDYKSKSLDAVERARANVIDELHAMFGMGS